MDNKTDVKQAAYANLARLASQGFASSDVYMADNCCKATVLVNGVPFTFIAGKLSALGYHEIPTFRIFPKWLQDPILQLRKSGYHLRVSEFKPAGKRLEFYLEVVLQLWEGGGAILSLKLTDEHYDRKNVDAFLSGLMTNTVTVPGGCSVRIKGPECYHKIIDVLEATLSPAYSYMLVKVAAGEWIIYLPHVDDKTLAELINLGDPTVNVDHFSWIDIRVPSNQE